MVYLSKKMKTLKKNVNYNIIFLKYTEISMYLMSFHVGKLSIQLIESFKINSW